MLTLIKTTPFFSRATILSLLGYSLALYGITSAYSQSTDNGKLKTKAEFIYNFAKFTTWPENAPQNTGDVITICLLGHAPFGELLNDMLADTTVRDRPLSVRKIVKSDAIEESCHILFISHSEQSELAHTLKKLEKQAVLTVSDIDQFAGQGGIIGLFEEDGRLYFEINLTASLNAGLKISSKLLRMAKVVDETTDGD